MSFTNKDLERLKDHINDERDCDHKYCDSTQKLNALLARLEAAEDLINFVESNIESMQFRKLHSVDKYMDFLNAWRTAAGR